MAPNPEKIMYGERDAMIAEVGAWDPRKAGIADEECAYLVVPIGQDQWDTEYFPTEGYAREHARALAKIYGATVGST